jgi:hypothetical protein
MRRLLLMATAVATVAVAALLTTARPDATAPAPGEAKFAVATEAKNPWTSLTPNVAEEQFQFAIVSDRTGGHRKGVFSKAVQQINLLQPEFVMSVGDLIEGNAQAQPNRDQWDEFDKYAKQFQMPFFYCAGNHDGNNKNKADVWAERLGRRYYHFVYRNCLFLVLNSNDRTVATGTTGLGFTKDQLAYAETALKENAGVRWTFVFMHHPVWAQRDLTETGMMELEALLSGRKHNLFCGHVHVFRKYLRNGTGYYQLATTGGGSALRGVEYGEFDQICWVTMKANGPVFAQVGLDGVHKDDLTPIESDEAGAVAKTDATLVPVAGSVTIDGKPATGITATFIPLDEPPPAKDATKSVPPSGLVLRDGTYTAYQNRGPAGLKPGRYAITFAPATPQIVDGKMKENPVPEKYRAANTTPLRIDVKAERINSFDFKLESK